MDQIRYLAAAALAGSSLLRNRPHPQPVHEVAGSERNAVYIVCDRSGTVMYVGSTCGRPARRRLAEHLADRDRTRQWDHAWVIPLQASTSVEQVRRVEGRVGRMLRPTDTRCLPGTA